jgi:S-DNA-T family DNA segregation ATPase FtsK/SpoIIIE
VRWRVPAPTQRDLDLLGLALVAVAVFAACVLYLDWDGGRAGDALAGGLAWLVGDARYAAPVAFAGTGAALVMRPLLSVGRPLGTGALCLVSAVTLGLAAGTLGVGPGAPPADELWARETFESRGGIVGEGLYWLASSAAREIGAHIAALFLLIAGLLLLTGASVATLLRATGTGVRDTTRVLRRSSGALAAPAGMAAEAFAARRGRREPSQIRPPERGDRDIVVRATHVEAPPLDTGPAPLDEADSLDEYPTGEHAAAIAAPPPGDDYRPDTDEPATQGEEGLTPGGRLRDVITDDPSFEWRLPASKRMLRRSEAAQTRPDTAGQEKTAARLTEALGHFGVQATVIGTVAGPHITRYELQLAPGTKVAKVAQLKDDLAYALAAVDIRILAPIPGRQAVGVEVPNAHRRIVRLGDVFQEPPADWSALSVWLGKDVAGRAIGADLAKMPHLLVAGTTGAGKSGAINAMLCSILLRATPHEVRLVLVDPKQVELNHYESIPHLLTPVITSPRMAANALANLVREMEERYGIMSLARTRSLPELNAARLRRGEPPLPYVLCVIDELADLMMVAPADVEDSVIRLAQKARAVGIHLVLATQSPRVDVITGMIKANVPSRIAFAVSSQTDSRVILDCNGAESLLGEGDMLFSPIGSSRLQRIQGAYIDEPQIEAITEFWRRQGEPEFREELLEEVEPIAGDEPAGDGTSPDEDPLLEDAIRLVAEMGTASTSMLQRRLRLGYTRAGRLIDMLERRGIISGYEGSKPRQVLIGEGDVPRVVAALAERAGPVAREPDPPEPSSVPAATADELP